MRHVPQIIDYAQEAINASDGFHLGWKSLYFKFDGSSLVYLMHLKEHGGLSLGDEVEFDEFSLNALFEKSENRPTKKFHFQQLTRETLMIGGFVSILGRLKGVGGARITAEQIFCFLIEVGCNFTFSICGQNRKIILCWPETLRLRQEKK